MKKNELKNGMLCELNNGRVYLYLNGTFVRKGAHNVLTNYLNDLTNPNHQGLSVNKISSVLKGWELRPENWTKETLFENLIWKREKQIDWDLNPLVSTVDEIGCKRIIRCTKSNGDFSSSFQGVLISESKKHYETGHFSTQWSKASAVLILGKEKRNLCF